MKYVEQEPIKRLSKYVEKIWHCSSAELTTSVMTIPFLNHELVFNLSEHYHINPATKKENRIENPKVWINGLQRKAYCTKSKGSHEMMGVLFKPNGLKPFVKFNAHEFTDRFVDATLIFGNSIMHMMEQLYDTNDVPKKFDLIEQFLLEKLSPSTASLPNYLPYSINKLLEGNSNKGQISTLCNTLNITNKSLIKAFNNNIGISPLKFLHLSVINKAIKTLSINPSQKLTDLAYELDFYDQAHFIRIFKSVTTLSPSSYASYLKNNLPEKSEANYIVEEG